MEGVAACCRDVGATSDLVKSTGGGGGCSTEQESPSVWNMYSERLSDRLHGHHFAR